MLLKVCGLRSVSSQRDIETLASAAVDLVGLWHAIPGGEADLPISELVRLSAAARQHAIEPVLVTFEHDAVALAGVVRRSRVGWVQLHAYQLPCMVAELRRALRGTSVTIVKVLHVRGEHCAEERLTSSYEHAGVDAFLLDVTTADGRVGSTGRSIAPAVAERLAGRLTRPFLLAGGIDAEAHWHYRGLTALPGFVGIDISTAAHDRRGRLELDRLQTINRAWRGRATTEPDVVVR